MREAFGHPFRTAASSVKGGMPPLLIQHLYVYSCLSGVEEQSPVN